MNQRRLNDLRAALKRADQARRVYNKARGDHIDGKGTDRLRALLAAGALCEKPIELSDSLARALADEVGELARHVTRARAAPSLSRQHPKSPATRLERARVGHT